MTRLQSAALIVSAGQTPPIPALLIKTSMRPNRSAISPMVRMICASSVMSASQPPAPPPISSATETIFGDLSKSASFAPRSRNSSAVALPIPPAAPVTRTTWPEKSKTRENEKLLVSDYVGVGHVPFFLSALMRATASALGLRERVHLRRSRHARPPIFYAHCGQSDRSTRPHRPHATLVLPSDYLMSPMLLCRSMHSSTLSLV